MLQSNNKFKRSQTNKKVKDKESSCGSCSSDEEKFEVITTSVPQQYQFPNMLLQPQN
jgi:hypothetical protein